MLMPGCVAMMMMMMVIMRDHAILRGLGRG
jgi:hypothetical protein